MARSCFLHALLLVSIAAGTRGVAGAQDSRPDPIGVPASPASTIRVNGKIRVAPGFPADWMSVVASRTSDIDGRLPRSVEVSPDRSGAWSMTLDRTRWEIRWLPGAYGCGTNRFLDLDDPRHAGSESIELDDMTPPNTLYAVSVVDASTGRPIAGAEIRMRFGDDRGGPREATDGRGHALLQNYRLLGGAERAAPDRVEAFARGYRSRVLPLGNPITNVVLVPRVAVRLRLPKAFELPRSIRARRLSAHIDVVPAEPAPLLRSWSASLQCRGEPSADVRAALRARIAPSIYRVELVLEMEDHNQGVFELRPPASEHTIVERVAFPTPLVVPETSDVIVYEVPISTERLDAALDALLERRR